MMQKKLLYRLALIIFLVGIACWFTFPLQKRINLGLDLKGGMHLVLRVDTSKLSPESKKGAVDRALEIIRNRIDEFGVNEPAIQLRGQDEIVLQLPGMTDRSRALSIVKRTGYLEYKLVEEKSQRLKEAIKGNIPDGYELKYLDDKPLLLQKKPVLTGEAIADAKIGFSQIEFGRPYISLKFTSKGAKDFARITKENIGRRLAIVLDGNVKIAPVIREAIPSGEAQITGRFTVEEAKEISIVLRVGSLPAPIYVEEERTIGPTLGEDSIKSGVKACIVGGLLVLICMTLYYFLTGVIANIALLLNLLFIFGGLGFLQASLPGFIATLTLPGIAGIVLTLGMAVDANVLINERIREEVYSGRPLRTAVRNGYDKAFRAIIDSNITTLVAAFFLFQFGTGPIRGFAITLSLGILSSLFTSIFVTRTILELFLLNNKITKLRSLALFRTTKIDFISKGRIFYTLSILVILVGAISFYSQGKNLYGVDFAGGQLQEYQFAKPIAISRLRTALREVNLENASIQELKDDPRQIIIRTPKDTAGIIQTKLKTFFNNNPFEILRIENVGPFVGRDLKNKAIKAIIFAMFGILFYVGLRFKHFDFAFAGIIALFHDILIALTFLALSHRQIDLLIVSALLTIAGYSINDTIVIYDRVRELIRQDLKRPIRDTINLAINQTLSRTVITSFTSILVVISLLIYGGKIINSFAFCILVGFLSGIYSTIFIVSPLVLLFQRKK